MISLTNTRPTKGTIRRQHRKTTLSRRRSSQTRHNQEYKIWQVYIHKKSFSSTCHIYYAYLNELAKNSHFRLFSWSFSLLAINSRLSWESCQRGQKKTRREGQGRRSGTAPNNWSERPLDGPRTATGRGPTHQARRTRSGQFCPGPRGLQHQRGGQEQGYRGCRGGAARGRGGPHQDL